MKPSSSSQLNLSPAVLSINQLARLNCREQLIIDPLQWTSRHVELLQCSFEEPSLAISITQSSFTDGRTGFSFVKTLFNRSNYGWREFEMRQILAAPECPLMSLLVHQISPAHLA